MLSILTGFALGGILPSIALRVYIARRLRAIVIKD